MYNSCLTLLSRATCLLLASMANCVMASHVCMATVCDLTVSAEIKQKRCTGRILGVQIQRTSREWQVYLSWQGSSTVYIDGCHCQWVPQHG